MGQNRISFAMYVFDQLLNGFGSGEKSTKFENMNKQLLIFLSFIGLLHFTAYSQTVPFEKEVREISAEIDSLGWESGSTLFTGSSTISDVENTGKRLFQMKTYSIQGFGGSKASDFRNPSFPHSHSIRTKSGFHLRGR